MKNSQSHKNDEAKPPPDMAADDPEGTMDRFMDGLRRVVSARRAPKVDRKRKSGRRTSGGT